MVRGKMLVGLVVALAVAVPRPAGVPVASAAGTPASAGQVEELNAKVKSGEREISSLRSDVNMTLIPIGILITVLTIGGALGVVFSIRDQRRITQLHELAVRGETASQRRSEESFISFLTESQKTLTLVNDTLTLAKQSTDRAAHAMEVNAEARVKAIEARAEDLMLRAFNSSEFESIVDDLHERNELGRIAEDLRQLEGYLELQNIPLPPNCSFVKAIEQFLSDDTRGALQVLRRAEQENRPGDLQRFTLYWIGYMELTVGEYENAIRKFRDDEGGLRGEDQEHHQLERMELEARFFETAERREHRGASTPYQRLQAVAKLIKDLDKLAARVEESDEHARKSRTSHEIARTRADVLAWVAHDDEAGWLRQKDIDAATAAGRKSPGPHTKPDVVRAWALQRAFEICNAQRAPDFYLAFARAECAFALRKDKRKLKAAYAAVGTKLTEESSKHRELRRTVELEQIGTICHSRLLVLCRKRDAQLREVEKRNVTLAARRALEALRDMSQAEVTVFSTMRRHNVSQPELEAEIQALLTVAGEKDGAVQGQLA